MQRLTSLVALSLLLACGGSTVNPCAGQAGSCVDLQVQGSGHIDALDIALSGSATRESTISFPGSSSLPVAVAILLPEAGGTFSISVAALHGTADISAGSVDGVIVAAGQQLQKTVTLSAIAVPASLTIVAGDDQAAVAGTGLAIPLTVKVADANGNATPGVAIGWTVVAGGSLSAATSTTNAGGMAQVTATVGVFGSNTFTASSAGLTSVTFDETGTAGATTLAVIAGNNQTATAGGALPVRLQVKATDASGNPAAASISWATASGGGVASSTSLTDASGFAFMTATLGPVAGLNTFTASSPGVTTVTFTETGTAGSATTLTKNAGDGQTGTAGTSLPVQLQVKVTDNFGNPVSGFTVHWAAASGGGAVSPASSVTNASGLTSTTAVTLGTVAGTDTFSASGTGLSTVIFTETAG